MLLLLMKKLLLSVFQWYFSKFCIRKGKIPVLNLITKLGLTKNVHLTGSYDNGILMHLDLDDWIQKQIFFFGRYEVEKLQTFYWQNNIKENQVILDIGANVGYYSLMAAKRNRHGTVYAFEPISKTFNRLQENISLNRFANIKPFNLAVADSDKSLKFFVGDEKNTGTSSITLHQNFNGELQTVRAITIDEFVVKEKISHIDYIKIDVEGAEMKVLRGMKKTLQQLNPTVLIELLDEKLLPAGSSVKEVYLFFAELAYKPFNIDSNLGLSPVSEPLEGSLILFKKD
jgi:FkbM family methyltransferase